MRPAITALAICVGLLTAPASALGAKFEFGGHIAGGPVASVSFRTSGRLTRNGKFIPKRVWNIRVFAIPYTCETPSHEVTSSSRSDLPFSSIGPLAVNKRGGFAGHYNPSGASYQITGSFHFKGRQARGSLLGYEGQPNVTTFCTTSLRRWTAGMTVASATPDTR